MDSANTITLIERIKSLEHDTELSETADRPCAFLPFVTFGALPSNITTTTYVFLASVNNVYTLSRWVQAVNPAAPNDGTNYWTVSLISDTGGTHASFTTIAMTDNVWNISDIASFSGAIAGKWMSVVVVPTSAPGTLQLAAPGVCVSM